jgi:hypothetical protein
MIKIAHSIVASRSVINILHSSDCLLKELPMRTRPIVMSLWAILLFPCAVLAPPDANTIIQKAIDHWRGTSSASVVTMTKHRADWERTMTMRSWTLGNKKSLVRSGKLCNLC